MADSRADLLSLENKVFASYLFYSAVLLLKSFAVVFVIAFYRLTNKVFPSEEDYKADPKREKQQVIRIHPDVERARRMQQNDLENIPFFIVLGLLYVLTNPAYATAIIVFRVFCGARVIHSLAYFFAVAPPRAMSFITALGCNIFLAVKVLQASKFLY